MKMAKKIIALVLVLVFALSFAACGGGDDDASGSLNVGVILVGDETEAYSLAHMNGIDKAVEKLADEGIEVSVTYKKKIPESDEVTTNAKDLIANGNTLIVTNSYGHQDYLDDVIDAFPNVNFVSMTGDKAAQSGKSNYFNAFTKIYQARYISGVDAGLKLKELIDEGKLTKDAYPSAFDSDGNIKIGYVGAYPYAEVVSGYTAFYLGIKSVVENVAMTVKYTNSWFSEEKEAAVAEYLMKEGCVVIGQHADSTGAPAAVQKAHDENPDLICYSVGYNVSMKDVAPDVCLCSSSNNWDAYYYELFKAVATGTEIPQDWAKGYEDKAVGIAGLNEEICAEGTKAKNIELEAKLADGSLEVFDTSKFTYDGGKTLEDGYKANVIPDSNYEADTAVVSDGVFHESEARSAPYFEVRIDGITEVDAD